MSPRRRGGARRRRDQHGHDWRDLGERRSGRERRQPHDTGNAWGNGGRWAAFGFLGGLTLGLVLWSQQLHQHRRGLFSRSSLRRLAALGYLSGHPSVDSARLLRDYMAWERRPVLRRRAEQILRQMEHSLG
jgi:hypothetical protein